LRTARLAALAATAIALAACGTTATHHTGGALPPRGNAEATAPGPANSPHCGIERWAVKTGTDPQAGQIGLGNVQQATVTQLASLPVPGNPDDHPGSRMGPVETTVYQVHATLVEYKQEADSDVHLVLSAGGRTMIAEIPLPSCVGAGSPLLPGITHARKQFEARYAPIGYWQQAQVPVVVTGVGFFDTLHGQTGVAPNGIELHPVLDIQFPAASSSPAPSPASASATRLGDSPPECVRVRLEYNSGNGPDYWVFFCGNGGGADSPMHDWMRGQALIVDGAPIGPGASIFGPYPPGS
jgi:hypothetical protein